MSTLAFVNGTAILPDRLVKNAIVLCEEGRICLADEGISKISAGATVIDACGGYIAPGYVDIHVHGGAGADFMDGTSAAVRTACQAHARHGTTTIFPTTTTGSPAQIHAMLAACAELKKHHTPQDGARIAGVHLYGPFFC